VRVENVARCLVAERLGVDRVACGGCQERWLAQEGRRLSLAVSLCTRLLPCRRLYRDTDRVPVAIIVPIAAIVVVVVVVVVVVIVGDGRETQGVHVVWLAKEEAFVVWSAQSKFTRREPMRKQGICAFTIGTSIQRAWPKPRTLEQKRATSKPDCPHGIWFGPKDLLGAVARKQA